MHLPSPVAYREDINGLRAWAVIAVLLFHFQLPGLGAGFFGVDIFFVISGFLMTAIIVKGLERNNFSIWKFYMARARRILPALMVVIAVLLALGWFWLPTQDYQALGTQSAYSLSFLSNIHFWRSTGYFDAAAHEKWLLHTWSLAVEAQFYLLFPIFLIILWKIKPQLKTLFWGLGFVFIASLALSIYAAGWRPVAAFYLLPTRGWELAAGGLAFLIGREVLALQRFAKPIFWVGFCLCALAFVLLDSTYAWPSGWALLPVLGTVLIILANQTQAKLTVNPLAQWFGDRSYSLYLWHWPLVVALYFSGLESDWLWISGAIGLSLVLANLSYHFVEVPTRSYLSASSLRKEAFTISIAVLVVVTSALIISQVYFDNRLPENLRNIDMAFNDSHPRRDECHTPAHGKLGSPGCVFGDNETLGVILVGDSHAASTLSPLVSSANKHHRDVLLWSFSACPTITNLFTSDRGEACHDSTIWILEHAEEFKKVPILIVNSLGYFQNNTSYIWHRNFNSNMKAVDKVLNNSLVEEEYLKTICKLTETRDVFLLRPYPTYKVNVPRYMFLKSLFNHNVDEPVNLSQPYKDYVESAYFFVSIQNKAVESCGAIVLDPTPSLCDDEFCYASKDGIPFYSDSNHLTEFGNKALTSAFEIIFNRN